MRSDDHHQVSAARSPAVARPAGGDGARQASSADDDALRLVADFLQNRPAAIATLSGWARGIAAYRAWGFDAPEDIVQSTLLALVSSFRAGRFTGGDLRGYVRRIAKNICVTSYRRARRRGTELPLGTGGGAGEIELAGPEPALDREQRALLGWLVAGLDPACRRLIGLAYVEGLSRKEIAARLAISEGAARVRLHRCLERARQRLQATGGRS